MQRGRKKGTAKTGGRVKGVPSKRTAEALNRAERLLEIIEAGNNLEKDVARMSPTSRMTLYKDALDFVQPRMQRVDHQGSGLTIINIKSSAIQTELATVPNIHELPVCAVDGQSE